MAENLLTEVFGAGTTQTTTEIRISKAGLSALLAGANYTFTPKDTNSTDEIMAALICAGLAVLTPANREVDPVNRNLEFTYDPTVNYDSLTLNNQTYNRHTISALFYKAVPTPTLNPSDY